MSFRKDLETGTVFALEILKVSMFGGSGWGRER